MAAVAAVLASTPNASVRPTTAFDGEAACEVGAKVKPLAPVLERVKRPRTPVADPNPPVPVPVPTILGQAGSRARGLTRASAAAPSLVPGFGQGGKVTTNVSHNGSTANDVALQPDGKIIVAGSLRIGANSNFAVVRYLPNGQLDGTFGTDGTVMTDFGGEDDARALALQPNGAIVVAGITKASTTRVALARYTSTGALDRSFGTAGQVVTSLASLGRGDSGALDVAVQPDRKIVLAGFTVRSFGRGGPDPDFAVARYTTRGALDGSFGTGGVATVDFGRGSDVARALVLQRDRRIVVVGESLQGSIFAAAVARLRPNGSRDPQFGVQGRVTLSTGFFWRGWEAAAVQPDGKIVAAGWASNCITFVFSVARYTVRGTLDTGFGTGGTVETSPSGVLLDLATDVALLPDGRILAGGLTVEPTNFDWDYALVRYRANGKLDTMRRGQPAIMVIRPTGLDDLANALVVQPNGRMILATKTYSGAAHSYELGPARVTVGGNLDSSFGSGGLAITNASAHADLVYDVAAQPDGGIIVAGVGVWQQTRVGVLARYAPDGARDLAFGRQWWFGRPSGLLLDGAKIVAVGDCCSAGYESMAGVHYRPDGSIEGHMGAIGGHPTLPRRAGLLGAAVLPNGKVVAAGFVETTGNSDIALMGWDQEWRRDPAFGTSGAVMTAIGSGNERAAAIAAQPDGRVLAAGFTDRDGTEDFALVSYLANGALDPTFGSGGIVVTPIGGGHDRATSLARQADGKIVVAGWARSAAGADVALARYGTDGALDPTFGNGGKAVFALAPGEDTAADVLVRADGVIIVAATVGTGAAADFALARVSPDGSIVETTTTDFLGGEDVARALAMMPDGTVIVAGSTHSARWHHDFALARYVVP